MVLVVYGVDERPIPGEGRILRSLARLSDSARLESLADLAVDAPDLAAFMAAL